MHKSFISSSPRFLLLTIIVFSLLFRLVGLWYPKTFYFDEVYHAFTAREILTGNPAAWEYWATPPQGFAYEWTHPPLAKIFMAFGMFLFGQNPIGFRLPGVFLGVAGVFLIYLLGELIFKKERIALLAALLFSLDGLVLSMSRIGMNDIYFLFFTLGTLVFFLKDKYFLSAIFLGMAISSKWTAFFVLPILFLAWVLYKKRLSKKYLWFLFAPPIIYISSYIPFFVSGHNLLQWWETQQQMWWYHTGLKATHSYSSPALSWPFLLRPLYAFVEESQSWVAKIYLMGSPAVFWGGIVSFFYLLSFVFKKKIDINVIFILISYLLFFLPWARSPRVMFIYHYLPAVPFMTLAMALVLDKLWQERKSLVIGYLILVALAFVFFYPHWTGIFVPKWLDNLYYWLPSWR